MRIKRRMMMMTTMLCTEFHIKFQPREFELGCREAIFIKFSIFKFIRTPFGGFLLQMNNCFYSFHEGTFFSHSFILMLCLFTEIRQKRENNNCNLSRGKTTYFERARRFLLSYYKLELWFSLLFLYKWRSFVLWKFLNWCTFISKLRKLVFKKSFHDFYLNFFIQIPTSYWKLSTYY